MTTDKRFSMRLALSSLLMAVAIVVTGLTTAAPAAADPVTPQGCQAWDLRLTLDFITGTDSHYDCSGLKNPRDSGIYKIYARGWSGYFYWGGDRYESCNWDVFEFTGDVYIPLDSLYLSPTKASWC